MKKSILLLLGLVVVSGCGGTEPLSLLGDPSVMPVLELPITSGSINTVTPYSSGNQSFTFNPSSSQSVLAAADGVVVEVNNATQGSASVTIRHSVHLTTVTGALLTASSPVGTYVTAGSLVGTTNNVTGISFAVYLDGALTCPLSYFSSTARQTLAARLAGTPCQN